MGTLFESGLNPQLKHQTLGVTSSLTEGFAALASRGGRGGLREQLCGMLPAGAKTTQARQFILPRFCQFGPLWGCHTNQVTDMIRVKNNLLHKTNRKPWWLFLTQVFFADVLCSSALRVVVWQN